MPSIANPKARRAAIRAWREVVARRYSYTALCSRLGRSSAAKHLLAGRQAPTCHVLARLPDAVVLEFLHRYRELLKG